MSRIWTRQAPNGIGYSIYYGARSGIVSEGAHPTLLNRIALLEWMRPGISVVSLVRPYKLQQKMRRDWQAGLRSAYVADPDAFHSDGSVGSKHMVQNDGYAYAVDIALGTAPELGGAKSQWDWRSVHRAAEFCGLGFCVKTEPWHAQINRPSVDTWRRGPVVEHDRSDYRNLLVSPAEELLLRLKAKKSDGAFAFFADLEVRKQDGEIPAEADNGEFLVTTPAPVTAEEAWYANELEEAVHLGITDGSNPDKFVTRAEAALMVLRGVNIIRDEEDS